MSDPSPFSGYLYLLVDPWTVLVLVLKGKIFQLSVGIRAPAEATTAAMINADIGNEF
jgi:hypothetical protein